MSYDAAHNRLYVPEGTSASAAKQIAGAIQAGGSLGSLAGAHEVGGMLAGNGLSAMYNVSSAEAAGHFGKGAYNVGQGVPAEENRLVPESVPEAEAADRARELLDAQAAEADGTAKLPTGPTYLSNQDSSTDDNASQSRITARPSRVRQGTEQGTWDSAADGVSGGKLCPTCGKEVRSLPRTTFKDWDNDHVPAWRSRDLTGLDRKGVLDNYNTGTQLRCVSCNRSDNGSGN